MKKIFALFLSLLIGCALSVCVIAERTLPLVVDDADLLTDWEETALNDTLSLLSDSRQIEIAVVTVNSTSGKSAMDYADDFYDYNGYGWGDNDDGVLLLVDMGNREYWITTHGLGQTYLGDYALYMIEEAFLDMLSYGNYYGAFSAFANACDEYIGYAISGEAYDDGYYNDYGELVTSYVDDYYYDDSSDEPDIIGTVGISLVVGFFISLAIVLGMKKGMTTVHSVHNAASYMVDGSLSLRAQGDRYLYSNTVRTPRNTNNSSGTRSGSSYRGGSSSHRSSSGRSHGGRGGRF
ncbi:MAG: TPM domain-containing protein [Clostridia bacterium]|nr:TPM domain-containing protein [Clostridia bacterium]